MGYIGDLKSNKISIRITDEALDFINSFPGDRLSEKFESMMKAVKDSHAPGEQFENEQFLIKKMLQKNGFVANRDLIVRIQLLNSITERLNTLQDIKNAYTDHVFPYGYSEETEGLINRIAKSLAYQERCQDREIE